MVPEVLSKEQLIQRKLEERARAKTDKLFLGEVLGMDFVAEVHAELFDQYIAFDNKKIWTEQSKVKNRLILWPRGHFKSSSLVVEIIQMILNFPDIRILIMQGTLTTTQRLLREILAHFTGTAQRSRLTELFPEFCGMKDNDGWHFGKKFMQATGSQFTTTARVQKQLQQATVTVASPNSVKTGQHYDAGFFDDLVNEKNYRSQKQLETARENFDMAHPLVDPGCYRYVTGTRYAFGDLYEVIMRRDSTNVQKEWVVSVKTCWTDDGKEVRFPKQLTRDGRKEVGITREELESIRRDKLAEFCSQYLNQPASTASQVFSKDFMDSSLVPPVEAGLTQGILFVDLASSDSEKSDDSVIICGKCDQNGRMYVADVRGGQWMPSQLLLHVIDMAARHRPLMILFENTAGAKYFVNDLRNSAMQRGLRLPIDMLPVSNAVGAKYVRIASLEGQIRNKRLFFFDGLAKWDKIVDQFTKFPGGKHQHDDYPDTIALMAQYFTGNTPFIKPLTDQQRFMKAFFPPETGERNPMVEDAPYSDNDMGDGFSC